MYNGQICLLVSRSGVRSRCAAPQQGTLWQIPDLAFPIQRAACSSTQTVRGGTSCKPLDYLVVRCSGFYVARAKGYYKDAGLDVDLLSPHMDEYKATPASRVAHGSATFACVPSESIISHHTWPGGVSTAPGLLHASDFDGSSSMRRCSNFFLIDMDIVVH
jgi:hypothetical protein